MNQNADTSTPPSGEFDLEASVEKLKRLAARVPVKSSLTLQDKAIALHEVSTILYKEKHMSYSNIIKWYKTHGMGNFSRHHIGLSLRGSKKSLLDQPTDTE